MFRRTAVAPTTAGHAAYTVAADNLLDEPSGGVVLSRAGQARCDFRGEGPPLQRTGHERSTKGSEGAAGTRGWLRARGDIGMDCQGAEVSERKEGAGTTARRAGVCGAAVGRSDVQDEERGGPPTARGEEQYTGVKNRRRSLALGPRSGMV